MGSDESIPHPGSLFQRKFIARLSLIIAKLEHLDDEETERKNNVEQKGHQLHLV